jgi:hypothetical protein
MARPPVEPPMSPANSVTGRLREGSNVSATNPPSGAPKRYTVSQARRRHILDGDHSGGGHRFGAGRGKTEFPRNWSDQDIVDAIEDVANDPSSTTIRKRGGGIILIGLRNSVSITAVVGITNEILTGYPT